MKAVVFAAGKSTRTYPLTLTRPKPLLPIANKPILAHQMDALPPEKRKRISPQASAKRAPGAGTSWLQPSSSLARATASSLTWEGKFSTRLQA